MNAKPILDRLNRQLGKLSFAPPVTHVFDLVAAEVARRMELQTTRTVDGPQSLLD